MTNEPGAPRMTNEPGTPVDVRKIKKGDRLRVCYSERDEIVVVEDIDEGEGGTFNLTVTPER